MKIARTKLDLRFFIDYLSFLLELPHYNVDIHNSWKIYVGTCIFKTEFSLRVTKISNNCIIRNHVVFSL